MAYIYDLTDTWNAGGTTFYGIKMNVTNTASASGSKLLSLQVGGSELFGVDKNGNVGIGTSAPGYKLDIVGNSPNINLRDNTAGVNWYQGPNSSNLYTFGNNAGSPLNTAFLNTNVGIGTASPGVKLDVIGTVRSTSFTATGTTAFQPQTTMVNHAADATGGYYIFYKGRAGGTTSQNGDTLGTLLWYGHDTGNAAVATSMITTVQTSAASAGVVPTALIFSNGGNAERMRIDNSGNVGIGTSAPGARLHTQGFSPYRGNAYTLASFSANATLAPLNIVQATDGTIPGISAGQNSTATFSSLGFYTSESERMRITPQGNLQLGTASLATNAADGFPYIPTCAGTPTGTPTAITGYAPMVVDSTNNKLYVYVGGAWQAMN